MRIREATARGMARAVVFLLTAALAGPVACADDYLQIALLAREAGTLPGLPQGAGAALEAADGDEGPHVCSCFMCLPMVVRSSFPLSVVLEKNLNRRPSAVCCVDSCYRPEIYRPPSV